jgi:hypothetical protein
MATDSATSGKLTRILKKFGRPFLVVVGFFVLLFAAETRVSQLSRLVAPSGSIDNTIGTGVAHADAPAPASGDSGDSGDSGCSSSSMCG